jgi:hypothetical protein
VAVRARKARRSSTPYRAASSHSWARKVSASNPVLR